MFLFVTFIGLCVGVMFLNYCSVGFCLGWFELVCDAFMFVSQGFRL